MIHVQGIIMDVNEEVMDAVIERRTRNVVNQHPSNFNIKVKKGLLYCSIDAKQGWTSGNDNDN